MHKQHPQTAYRKDAVLIGTIFENCDKKLRIVPEEQQNTRLRIVCKAQYTGGCCFVVVRLLRQKGVKLSF